jgi:FtsP/CotA-like multicopper oxidase with cupredoxin domain
MLTLTACGLADNGFQGGGFAADDVVASEVDPATPATNELMIPPLLEPAEGPVARFDLSLGQSDHDFGSGTLTETVSYNGQSILGPTLLWRSGSEVELHVTNDLNEGTTAHWHGADVPAEDDGGPHSLIDPGQTWVADFEVIQPAATLWYHPHMMGTSAEQVFHGAAGMIIVEDDNPAAADLPNTYGVDDIPVILQDREFAADGQLSFEIDNDDDGDLNPDLTVNGTIDPYTTVPAGPVRLRLLNGSQARVYELSVDSGDMTKIASDGGYLSSPVTLETITVGPGDRAEIIVDTSDGPVALLDGNFGRVLELRPDGSLPAAQFPPQQLAEIDVITVDEIDNDRTFVMDEVGNGWGINGNQMDMGRVDEVVRFGDTERWTITVEDGIHTFHVHQTQFQILSINGEPPPPEEAGWEDTVLVTEGREVVIAARFDSYTNPDVPYMFHCHILDHEDLGMMGQFRVVDEP